MADLTMFLEQMLHVLRTDTVWSDWLLVLLAPVFLLAVGIEWLRFRLRFRDAASHRADGHRQPIYHLRDSLDSLNLGGIYTLLDVLIVATLVLPAMGWVYAQRVASIDITPWSFLALYLGVELCYYGFHRASHRIRWFWCAHVVHHGSEFMNFTTAMRQSWLYSFAGNWLFYLPMVWLGFEPRWVLLALSINLGYQFFVHTQWVVKMPAWFEFIFNTPSHHRAHHGRNARYIDCNYGGTLIVFDRLFGSFVPETEAVDYGLVRQVHSHNLLWLTLHEWAHMLSDVLRPGPWALRIKHIWGPPEWQRPGSHEHALPGAQAADNPPHAPKRSARPHDPAHP